MASSTFGTAPMLTIVCPTCDQSIDVVSLRLYLRISDDEPRDLTNDYPPVLRETHALDAATTHSVEKPTVNTSTPARR